MITAPTLPTPLSTSRVAAVARASSNHLGWDQPNCQPDSARRDDQVIEVAENGNEIGDQINRAERMRHNEKDQRFCIPGRARVRAAI